MTTETLKSGNSLNTSKVKNSALWFLQIAGALMFIMSGANKLAGNEMMVQVFNAIGIGQWFRYVTGVIEVASALLLLTPAFSGIGAILLAGTMTGAVISHITVLGGSFAVPAILLSAMVVVAYGRKENIIKLIKK